MSVLKPLLDGWGTDQRGSCSERAGASRGHSLATYPEDSVLWNLRCYSVLDGWGTDQRGSCSERAGASRALSARIVLK